MISPLIFAMLASFQPPGPSAPPINLTHELYAGTKIRFLWNNNGDNLSETRLYQNGGSTPVATIPAGQTSYDTGQDESLWTSAEVRHYRNGQESAGAFW